MVKKLSLPSRFKTGWYEEEPLQNVVLYWADGFYYDRHKKLAFVVLEYQVFMLDCWEWLGEYKVLSYVPIRQVEYELLLELKKHKLLSPEQKRLIYAEENRRYVRGLVTAVRKIMGRARKCKQEN